MANALPLALNQIDTKLGKDDILSSNQQLGQSLLASGEFTTASIETNVLWAVVKFPCPTDRSISNHSPLASALLLLFKLSELSGLTQREQL